MLPVLSDTLYVESDYCPGASESPLSASERRRLLLQYGTQSSAYFSFQPGVQYFGSAQRGFVSYCPLGWLQGGADVVFNNPVCADENLAPLLDHFLATRSRPVIFVGIEDKVAQFLAHLGYRTNEMGTEFSFPLEGFSVRGKHKKQLRHAANLGERFGLRVEERRASQMDIDEVEAISRRWLKQKAVRRGELRLLTRPPQHRDEWLSRRFYCFQGERLLGYIYFDPYFSQGGVAGYCANILRSAPGTGPAGLLDYTLLQAIEQFRREGVARLSLGIAPLHGLQAAPGENPMLRRIGEWLYRHGSGLYAFAPLAYHKTRYRGEESKWYLAYKNLSAPRLLWSLMAGAGVLGP
ncbi:uncharacterized conserved protein [Hahella chejuensis KCTC 2396]|uniref:Uncharacterized conserved protein n=1 Tax=Hahella chejuensis (strain KCTC 2396) TaxID=349521 RepID=Q2SA95_HAHCH|nr:DUF2156 domain-containing protein [Hahella chejuensis]ABC32429.1 uncharacterized conserved protein [Hahella chejuensis KCTC 2396]